jgi:hypothetical protein
MAPHMIKKIIDFLKASTTQQLFFYPLLLSFVFIIILVAFSFADDSQSLTKTVILNIILFLWGSSGLPLIIRKECVPPWYEKGWFAATLQGLIMIIPMWGLVVMSFLKLFRAFFSE